MTSVAEVKIHTKGTTAGESLDAGKTDSPLLKDLLKNVNQVAAAEIRAFHADNNAADRNNLLRMWNQGRRITTLADQKLWKSRTGDEKINLIKLLAEFEKVSTSYLYKMAQLYRAFSTERERDKLLAHRMAESGKPLTWAHMELLLKLFPRDGKAREAFDAALQRTLKNDWQPSDVAGFIKTKRKLKGEKTSRGGGRPLNIPPTFHGRISRFSKQVEQLLNSCETIYDNESYDLDSAVRSMSQDEVAENAEDIITQGTTLKEGLAKLIASFQYQLDEVIPNALSYARQCAKTRASKTGKADAAALEEEDNKSAPPAKAAKTIIPIASSLPFEEDDDDDDDDD